jgi:hypothetical protein
LTGVEAVGDSPNTENVEFWERAGVVDVDEGGGDGDFCGAKMLRPLTDANGELVEA